MATYFRSIRFRLWCLAALFLVPQIFQISIILRRAEADIVFTQKERLGTAYLQAVWPLKNAVDRSVARILPLGPIEPLIEGLEKARAAYDVDLETGSESDAVMKALRSVRSISGHDHVNERIFALMTRIGDKSNLILDPDLDTYYLMSLVVERLPELSRDAAKANLALEVIRKEGASPETIDQLKFTEAFFASSVAKVAHGIRLGLASTEDVSVNGRLSKPYADLAVINTEIADLYRQIGVRMQGNGLHPAALTEKITEKCDIFRSRIDEIYKLTLSELDRLLAVRITKQEFARNRDLALVGLFMLAALGIAMFLSSTIMRNLRRLRFSLDAMGNGDFSADIAALERKDELGGLARAVQRVRDTITTKLHNDFSAEKASLVRDEQRRIFAGMASELDHAVTGSVLTIDSLGSELNQTVGFVSNSTAATRRAINASVEALDSSVASVRAATISLSELAVSVAEISGQASRAADATRIARDRAHEAKTRSAELDKTVAEIQASARLVESIAAQTNLLALNATIEAARAGEAGRGFAVVAQEVKMLAAQSAKTTAEIQARVIAVSQVSHSVTSAIDEMGETINRMDEVSLSIAAAVEQHNITTAEITARVQQTADGADQVARQITDVSAMADSTDEVASSLTGLAGKLTNEANTLRRESTRFMSRLVG